MISRLHSNREHLMRNKQVAKEQLGADGMDLGELSDLSLKEEMKASGTPTDSKRGNRAPPLVGMVHG